MAFLDFKLIRYCGFIITLLFTLNNGYSQDQFDFKKSTDVLPPSPNAASLGRYDGVEVGLSTGTFQYEVPLTQIQLKGIVLPVSLQYASNGLRVDEISPRAGTFWNLVAGGIITRTVLGRIDEYSNRISPPGTYPQRTRELVNFLNDLSDTEGVGNGWDGEPDVFTFNVGGYSGKFILNSQKSPVLLTHSALKIEYISTNVENGEFRITAPDGVIYEFKVKETTNRITAGQGCGKQFPSAAATAFYLTKIVHPNGNFITLGYSSIYMTHYSGVSTFAYRRDELYNGAICNPVSYPELQFNTTCVNILEVTSPILTEISASDGAKITFEYINRKDCDDYLLQALNIYLPNSVVWDQRYELVHEQVKSAVTTLQSGVARDSNLFYRPFLKSIIERSKENRIGKHYDFSYYNLDYLPCRLSTSQDYFGYFNGKHNTTLLSRPKEINLQQLFPQATADRQPDSNFIKTGLLSKIVHPTAGATEIFYEGNTEYRTEETRTPSTVSVSVAGVGLTEIGYGSSNNIAIAAAQQVILNVNCGFSPPPDVEDDSRHHLGVVEVVNINTNQVLYSLSVAAGEHLQRVFHIPANVVVKINVSSSRGQYVRTGATLTYETIVSVTKNVLSAGARVSRVVNSNLSGEAVSRKYKYSKMETPAQSSAGLIRQPIFQKYMSVYTICRPTQLSCDVNTFKYYYLSSSPLNNLIAYSGALPHYASVIEEYEGPSGNGGIVHQFSLVNDIAGNPVLGDDIPDAPYTSNSHLHGKKTSELIFKKINNSFIPVSEKKFHYKTDSRINTDYKGYLVRKKIQPCSTGGIPDDIELIAYDLLEYKHLQRWVYMDTVTSILYNSSGSGSVYSTEIYDYKNPIHAQPSIRTVIDSKGEQLVSYTTFASDYATSNNFADAMKLAHLAQFPIEELTIKKKAGINYIVSGQINEYTNDGKPYKSKILNLEATKPIIYNTFKFSNLAQGSDLTSSVNAPYIPDVSYKSSIQFEDYDGKGNLLSVSKTEGPKTCYVYSYNGQYPIAKIENAQYSTVVTALNGNSAIQVFRDRANPTYQEIKNFLLPLDAALPGAMITTYTYKPQVGITSETDAKGRTTYYDYDSFGRLQLIRDHENKVIKQFCYNYSGQVVDCGGIQH